MHLKQLSKLIEYVKVTAFWDMTPCTSVERHLHSTVQSMMADSQFLFCGPLYKHCEYVGDIAPNIGNDDKLERIWKGLVMTPTRYSPKNWSGGLEGGGHEDRQCIGQDLNQAPPKYKSTALQLGQPVLRRHRKHIIVPRMLSSWM
jgi:hypothetical protein